MVQTRSRMVCADNSGAKSLVCIKVLGGSKKRVAKVGEIVVVAVKESIPNSKVKKGSVQKAVIVRGKDIPRKDGCIDFDEWAAVLVNNSGDMIGTRVFGPIAREVRNHGHSKIVSAAPEVL